MKIVTLTFGYLFLGAALLGMFTLLFRAMTGRWTLKSRWLDIVVIAGVVIAGFIIGALLLIGGRA